MMNADETKDIENRVARKAERLPPTTQRPQADDRASEDTLVVYPTKKGPGTND